MENKEIEVRFLEINKQDLLDKLLKLGAKDLGEVMLEEVIVYDKDLEWLNHKRLIRLRKNGDKISLTYKQHFPDPKEPADEVELKIDNLDQAIIFLEKIGFVAYRRQQKYRHTVKLGDVTLDFDTWPKIPTYVELEGPSVEALKSTAEKLGLDWPKAVYDDARMVIENIYKIPLGKMKWFTFNRFE